jgi:hypothetical protein
LSPRPCAVKKTLAGAERSSALQRAILALVMPTHKRHFARGRLQLLASSTYCRAKLFESDRLRPISALSVGRRAALCASPRGEMVLPEFFHTFKTMCAPLAFSPKNRAGCRIPSIRRCIQIDTMQPLAAPKSRVRFAFATTRNRERTRIGTNQKAYDMMRVRLNAPWYERSDSRFQRGRCTPEVWP